MLQLEACLESLKLVLECVSANGRRCVEPLAAAATELFASAPSSSVASSVAPAPPSVLSVSVSSVPSVPSVTALPQSPSAAPTAASPVKAPLAENSTSIHPPAAAAPSAGAASLPAKKPGSPSKSPLIGTRHLHHGRHATAPKLPVHSNEDGKLPPWLRPNRKMPAPHSCSTCLGRKCSLCDQGCLTHESTLLICSGASYGCAKIRKLAVYYVAPDGARQYCQKCYADLPALLP